jgi:hypothetical protein
MSPDACRRWLNGELNRTAEAFDLYQAGKQLYQLGMYIGASKLLALYVDGNGNELPGNHLLGYAYYMIEERRPAVQQLKKVVNSGFDADWQLLVELQVELDRIDGVMSTPDESIQAPM